LVPWRLGSAVLVLSLLLQVYAFPLVTAQVDTSREDQILKNALDYIETGRKGTLEIQFVDSMTGRNVNDVEVQYQQILHDFMFSTHWANDAHRMQSAGLEWSGDVSLSWAEIEPSRGIYDFSKPDNALLWLRGGYYSTGYRQVRLWAQFRSLFLDSQYLEAPRPPSFADFDHIADPVIFARYKDLVYEFVHKAATVYKDKISAYVTQPGINWPGQAVVAGLSRQPAWTIHQAVELNKVVSKAIREADPSAIIVLGSSTPWKGPFQSDVDALQFTKFCLDAGVDVDMVALEAWPSDGTPSFFYDYVKKLAQLGKPVFIKETGYPSEEPTAESSWLKSGKWKVFDEHAQALWFRYIFTFAFGMKEAAGVGLNVLRDDVNWRVGAFTTAWEPKESAAMLQGLMSNFTTSGTSRTDRSGVLVLQGFAGDYTVQVRGYEPVTVHVTEGQIEKLVVNVSSSSIIPLEVDFSKTVGRIRSLLGVNVASPAPLLVPFQEQYRKIGVDYVRTHDAFDAFDINIVFPNVRADPASESSYNFTSTDSQVEAIRSVGAQVLYRLGYSFSFYGVPIFPEQPRDYARFAEVCKHIVMHYNYGWANGFHYGIQYWEVWNEPDLRQLWAGTPQEYFALYDTVARTLKSVDPQIKVGGPALAGNVTLLEKFLQFCKANESPLDFVSWHIYPGEISPPTHLSGPHLMAETAWQIQDLLETYQFDKVENFITEWNFCFSTSASPCDWKARGAAWAASALIYLQDTSVSRAFRYGPTNVQFDKTANAFLAMTNMLQSPIRLACNGSDNVGFAALAGRSENGDNGKVLISDFDGDYNEFALTVNNLPWQGKIVVIEIYLSDDTHDMTLVQRFEQMQSGSVVIRHTISPSSIYLITLHAKEPSAESTTRTLVGLIGQSLFPLFAALVVVSVAVISYMFKKRRNRSGAS